MIFHKTMLAGILVLLVGISSVHGQTPAGDSKDPRIKELIRKLGSSSFVQREQARKELQAIGASALETLRHASKSADVETKRRLAELIGRFEEELLTKQVLAPTEIHLKVADAGMDQVIAELSKIYPLQFQGDRTLLGDKKFTLDTGKTSFWQALDQFCDQAGLIEKIDVSATFTERYTTVRGGGKRITRVDMGTPPTPGPILLAPRSNEKTFASYAGAVKSQLRLSRDAKTKELVLTFIISAEPRLVNIGVEGRPLFEKAIDHEQQKVTALFQLTTAEPVAMDSDLLPPGAYVVPTSAQRRLTQIRLKEGDISAKLLKELAGKLAVQVDRTNEPLAKVPNVMQASGKSTAGAQGGTLTVNSVRKIGADIEVDVTLENLTPNPLGGNIVINGGNIVIRGNVVVRNIVVGRGGVRIAGPDNQHELPDLLDAKGQKYLVAGVTSDGVQIANGSYSRTATILYRPRPQQGEPSELVLYGTRTHTIAVPFRFENVRLPISWNDLETFPLERGRQRDP